MSEGLAQGPYMAADVGFEPATLRMQGTEHTTEPPRPTMDDNGGHSFVPITTKWMA